MKKFIKNNKILYSVYINIKDFLLLVLWLLKRKNGAAPRLYKWITINEFRKERSSRVFVETGTCTGETLFKFVNRFKKAYSIELSKSLFNGVKKRFLNFPNVELFQGDSSQILPQIIPNIKEQALFWLDAHYSGPHTAKGDKETPIIKEMEIILKNWREGTVVLIDDARLFVGMDDYPAMDDFRSFIKEKNPNLNFEVKGDIIRIFDKS
jgi:hypothetical protein